MINILPYKQKKTIERLRMVRVATVTVWALTFLAGAAMLLLLPIMVTVDSRFSITETQLGFLERSGVVANPVDVAALQVRTERLVTKLATPFSKSPTYYVGVVRSLIPSGVSISSYTVSNSENSILEIHGIALTRATLQSFVAKLEKEEAITSVESPVANYVKNVNSDFKITLTFQ